MVSFGFPQEQFPRVGRPPLKTPQKGPRVVTREVTGKVIRRGEMRRRKRKTTMMRRRRRIKRAAAATAAAAAVAAPRPPPSAAEAAL